MININEELKELENKRSELKQKLEQQQNEEHKKDNYERFKDRKSDWAIGKAHADIALEDARYGYSRNRTIGDCISISGNCGHTYNAKVQVTESTYMFFHNVWSSKQRSLFREKLNKLAIEEINNIMNTLKQKLELMGLQGSRFYISELFPEDKYDEVNADIFKEQCKILDKYSDEDFLALIVVEKHRTNDKGVIPPYKDIDLSHSCGILKDYIKAKRRHLLQQFSKIRRW